MKLRHLAICLFFAALALTAPRVRADDNAVHFFHDIVITPDEPVDDAVCFFCNVRVQGTVEGDIVVFFGSVRLNGDAHHDIVDFFGRVSAADGSTIGDDVVDFFGNIRLGENVTVAHDTVAMFGSINAPASATNRGDRVSLSPWLFYGPFLVIFLIIFLIVHEVRVRRARRFAQYYSTPLPPVASAPPKSQQ